jgi:hypothetical protein
VTAHFSPSFIKCIYEEVSLADSETLPLSRKVDFASKHVAFRASELATEIEFGRAAETFHFSVRRHFMFGELINRAVFHQFHVVAIQRDALTTNEY